MAFPLGDFYAIFIFLESFMLSRLLKFGWIRSRGSDVFGILSSFGLEKITALVTSSVGHKNEQQESAPTIAFTFMTGR